ncbi:MAG: methyltransferase domain-containing protein [Thermaurantiacus sp.]
MYNFISLLKQKLGIINSNSGAASSKRSVEDSLLYADRVVRDYIEILGSSFFGHVAEVGPGDSCAVALKIIENGAKKIDLVDRFYSNRKSSNIDLIHQKIVQESPILSSFFDLNNIDISKLGIKRFYGPAASAENFFGRTIKYDFIVSRAVLEHVQNIEESLTKMASSLSVNGKMVHIVDLRDHGMFSKYGFHELEFLTVTDSIYQAMTNHCGHPNRVPITQYRTALQKSNVDASFLILRLVGEADWHQPLLWEEIAPERVRQATSLVQKVRPRLAKSLRDVPDEDLAISGFALIAVSRS